MYVCNVCMHKTKQKQSVFPMLSSFSKQPQQESVTIPLPSPSGATKTVLCDVWRFIAGTHQQSGDYNSTLPDANSYSGVYTFFVNAQDGTPVTFSMRGHNVLVGDSHVDEYWMDYLSVISLENVDDFLFSPPTGMSFLFLSVRSLHDVCG